MAVKIGKKAPIKIIRILAVELRPKNAMESGDPGDWWNWAKEVYDNQRPE